MTDCAHLSTTAQPPTKFDGYVSVYFTPLLKGLIPPAAVRKSLVVQLSTTAQAFSHYSSVVNRVMDNAAEKVACLNSRLSRGVRGREASIGMARWIELVRMR
jgi:hypothetical protein